ncbi:dynein axonemal assembly factor 1 homolog [Littorina saxatilis]|uniref:Leucine-rich repeat-containing protein 56 n=1 Tax=Littorina saxatilis TaxID=31220 RepID=A0AAN9G7T1_9CAEN
MALACESPMSQNIPKMDSGLQRPQSALARGVQITELSDGCMNPEPIVMQESDILMEQYLSPTKLQLLTGSDNLDQVDTLELKVNTSETTLNNFGSLLPNLRVLKLSGSVIPNIRDLGSSLRNLEVLWMSRCGLEEMDGISSMLKLRELYLAYNEIADISPLTMLDELEILDLEGNNIDDIGQVQYLSLCSNLKHLTLDGNPICVTPTVTAEEVNYDYRVVVGRTLVNLVTLDDNSLADTGSSSPQNVFDADWAYLEELQKDALLIESLESEKETVSAAGRPTTAALKPATAYRPGSALRPSSGFRPSTASQRPASISGGRPSSAWTENSKRRPASSDAAEGMESTSELTCGTVICGNPSKALRARRKIPDSPESVDPSEDPNVLSSRPPTGSRSQPKVVRGTLEEKQKMVEGEGLEEKDISDLMQELQSWKDEHEKRLKKIRESKAPQVFTISHEGNSDLSDNQSDLSDNDDLDFRPDSAMDKYRSQQYQDMYQKKDMQSSGGLSHFKHGDGDESFDGEFPNYDIQQKNKPAIQPARPGMQKKKEYEKSLDEDERLQKEYERLANLEKNQERSRDGDRPSSREGGKLRELRIPSAGPRQPSPRRVVSPRMAPFPTSFMDPSLSPGRESPRPRKIRIGPTGLPGSSNSNQPQVRDILSPQGLGGLVPPSAGQRPPSTGLQHRIRRTLPDVTSLPSRPPPVTKS